MLQFWQKCSNCGHEVTPTYEHQKCSECERGYYVQDTPFVNMDDLTIEDKANLYDELQRWFWWLDRRTKGGWGSAFHVKTFMSEIEKLFKPYKEEK